MKRLTWKEPTTRAATFKNWLYRGIGYNADAIPEKSVQKIFRAADQILRAGLGSNERSAE